MLCVEQFVWVWGSEFLLCVGLYGVGLGECVCAVCGRACVGLGSECVLCLGEFNVGLRNCVCAVCGRVVCVFGGVSVCCVWDKFAWDRGVIVCCVWENLVWIWGSECVLGVGVFVVGLSE